jgi:hypothetical protein
LQNIIIPEQNEQKFLDCYQVHNWQNLLGAAGAGAGSGLAAAWAFFFFFLDFFFSPGTDAKVGADVDEEFPYLPCTLALSYIPPSPYPLLLPPPPPPPLFQESWFPYPPMP